MQLLRPASRLVFLLLLIPTRFSVQRSAQPFSTQSIPNNNLSSSNTATTKPSKPPHFAFHLLEFRAIIASSHTEQWVIKAIERTYEVIAYSLFEYDVLDAHDFVLRFGAFTLEYHDLVELLNILAIKAVVTKLLQMVMKGLLGFVKGEMVDAQAGVKMIFAFGVLDGGI